MQIDDDVIRQWEAEIAAYDAKIEHMQEARDRLRNSRCINCARRFGEDEPRVYYSAVTASAAVRQVGPLCEGCEQVLTIARAVRR